MGEALAMQAGGPESEPQRLSEATLVRRETGILEARPATRLLCTAMKINKRDPL